MEGLRDFGYSLSAALADIIDNAIAKGATTISVETAMFDQASYIAIIDDGGGMSRAELLAAMVLGSQDPRATREQGDLGRFGLGLKTASFSQCRRLTVVTRADGVTSAARWELDLVSRTSDWLWNSQPRPTPGRWLRRFQVRIDRYRTGDALSAEDLRRRAATIA